MSCSVPQLNLNCFHQDGSQLSICSSIFILLLLNFITLYYFLFAELKIKLETFILKFFYNFMEATRDKCITIFTVELHLLILITGKTVSLSIYMHVQLMALCTLLLALNPLFWQNSRVSHKVCLISVLIYSAVLVLYQISLSSEVNYGWNYSMLWEGFILLDAVPSTRKETELWQMMYELLLTVGPDFSVSPPVTSVCYPLTS